MSAKTRLTISTRNWFGAFDCVCLVVEGDAEDCVRADWAACLIFHLVILMTRWKNKTTVRIHENSAKAATIERPVLMDGLIRREPVPDSNSDRLSSPLSGAGPEANAMARPVVPRKRRERERERGRGGYYG